MISRLLEEVEQIFAWDELQNEQEEGSGLERTVKRHDVRMRTKRLVQGSLYARIV